MAGRNEHLAGDVNTNLRGTSVPFVTSLWSFHSSMHKHSISEGEAERANDGHFSSPWKFIDNIVKNLVSVFL